MTTKNTTENVTADNIDDATGNAAAKDPSDWVTGGEPATASQRSYLETLAADSGADVPEELTKADASQLIDELQDRSPRLD